MASVADYGEEFDMDTGEQREEIRKECFRILFQYLRSKDVVKKCFIDKLPTHITSIDNNKNIWKGSESSYGEYNLTFEQDFQTTRPASLEEDVHSTWFMNKPPTEEMAWMEILRKKRSYLESEEYVPKFSFSRVKVIGGSMTSPVTFVRHWELSNFSDDLSVSFLFESSKLLIDKKRSFNDSNNFVLEISYDSIDGTIFVQNTNNVIIMVITIKTCPKIYDNSVRVSAKNTGFDGIGNLNSFCFEFKAQDQSPELKQLLSRLICIGFRVTHITIQSKLPELKREILLPDNFEIKYAWQCVDSIGFKLTDHLTSEVKRYIEQMAHKDTQLVTEVFYNLAIALMEKPFFHFQDEFNCVMKKTQKSKIDYKNELPSHYSMVARMVLTPTKSLFLPKEPVFQNRIVREYGEDYFIRVVFRDEDSEKISTVQSHALSTILESMKTSFKSGFQINNRHYEFLGCSNSQLREHSFWFFHPHDGITSESIINCSGEFSTERCVASYVSRFGLCFSSTKKTVDVDKSCVRYIDEVKNEEYCFTDGIGRISAKLAKKVADKLQIHPVPSAFQIRFGGCKGMVAQDPTLGNDTDILVIRKSMKKFESKSNNLEILDVTGPGRLYLNKQVITLLSGLGIQDHVFLNLQENMLVDIADILLYDHLALPALLEAAVGIEFGLIADKNISFVREPFFRSLLQAIYSNKMKNLMERTKIQIPLDKGRIMIGTSDETMTLESGEVFIQYSKKTITPGKNLSTYEGLVVVTKNPCFHEGDIRVFKAVNVPSLSHMVDCIVFPQKGQRPHPDEMSGSDLDGDMYFVCWDPELCQFQNKTPMDFPKAEKTQLTREVNSSDVIDFLTEYIKYDKLGLIANAHLVQADSNKNGIFSNECHRLAKMHSDAVDFPKTGKIPTFDDDLRPKSYPDFMMKSDKEIYTSNKIIGTLFRQCQSLLQLRKQSGIIITEDRDFILPNIDKNILMAAKSARDQYMRKVMEVLDLYGIKHENEAITGLVHSVKSSNGCLKAEKFQVGQIVKDKMCMIRKKTRESFFEEFGGESNISKEDPRVLQKASAWYHVTYVDEMYSSRNILSFPWTVADILVLMKKSFSNNPQNCSLKDSLHEFYKLQQTKRNERDKWLKIMYSNVQNLLNMSSNAEFSKRIIGLEFSGLLKSEVNLNVGTTRLQLEVITKALKDMDIMEIPKPFEDPCYCVTYNENAYVRFVSDVSIINLSSAMKEYFSERCKMLVPVAQFLLDMLQDIFPVDSNGFVFSDLGAIAILYLTMSNNTIFKNSFASNTSDESAKWLLSVLKCYILSYRTWDLNKNEVLKDGFNALGISQPALSELSEKCMIVYQRVALIVDRNPFLKTPKLSDFENYYDEYYEEFLLASNVLNTITRSEKYVENQLRKITGAYVYFNHNPYLNHNQTRPDILRAWGTERELYELLEIIHNIKKSCSKLNVHAEKGHIVVENAYCLVFQGGCEKSELTFEKYGGTHREMHNEQERYVPKLIHVTSDRSCNDFETRFVQQWNVLKTGYNAVFHGDLFLSISFGKFYVMNIECNSALKVMELNKLFTTIHLRQRDARQTAPKRKKKTKQVKVPYTFSFQPVVFSDTGKVRKVLEHFGFTEENDGIKKTKISLIFKSSVLGRHDFNECGELFCINFSEIKWFMANVIPESSNNSTPNIRYKLLSSRDLDGKHVSKKDMKTLKADTNGYQLPQACHVVYAREKVVQSYSLTGWFAGYKVMVETATVNELKEDAGKLTPNGDARVEEVEVLVLPEIPNIYTPAEELTSYARHLWKWTLDLAAEFEDM